MLEIIYFLFINYVFEYNLKYFSFTNYLIVNNNFNVYKFFE
jgi:hypothetical protein